MLQVITTELLLEEIETDGHAPLKFLCSSGDIYYCKYLNDFNKLEINCLAYEVIAHYLLKKLQIPTPEIALIKISDGTLDKSKIKANRRLKEGNICFGSKEVKLAQELQAIQDFTKVDFNRLLNPEDVVKIALFDLWVDNTDRGRFFENGINYNILIESIDTRQKIVAFDNAFIFGGVKNIGIFNSLSVVNTTNKLLETPFYKSVIKYIDIEYLNQIVNNFVTLLTRDYNQLIIDIIAKLPAEWILTKNLDNRICDYLSNQEHINRIKHIVLQSKR